MLPCHGTPASDLTYFMETFIPGFGIDGAPCLRAASPTELAGRAAETPLDGSRDRRAASLILCGHTHMPRAMAVAGGPRVVNPGRVGLQAHDDDHPVAHVVENGSPAARWALAERDGRGGWHVQLRATPCDWRAAVARAEAGRRPVGAHALATGFARPMATP